MKTFPIQLAGILHGTTGRARINALWHARRTLILSTETLEYSTDDILELSRVVSWLDNERRRETFALYG